MSVTAKAVLDVARSWIGYSEANGKYKEILKLYNDKTSGYDMKNTDAWCDCFVSAVAIKAGATDIIGTEVGCERHIDIFKKLGIWLEDGTITPQVGDIILFNWDDGTQPNDGFADHIGFVEAVNGNVITCIEGNISESVGRRTIKVGWGYIRGYARPKYSSSSSTSTKTTNSQPTITSPSVKCTITINQLQNGANGNQVKTLQSLLIANGYSCGKYKDDGEFGADTEAAVKKYQKANKLEVDGVVGVNTWNKLLGIK